MCLFNYLRAMIKILANKIIALVLVTIFLANNIRTLTVVGNFVINQDFIAKTLCIQKDNQQGCNGKCHLKKELQKTSSNPNSDKSLPENKRQSLDVFYVSDINYLKKQLVRLQLEKNLTCFNLPKINKTYLDIDTPPPNFI